MLRTVNAQPTLWEAILPEMCLGMPAELEAVDRLLDDAAFFKPFRAHFHAALGRPSVPIETYLRLMFLKYRYRLGFEPLCREVADSISWQRFCRIPLGVAVPHPTTLMKITTRCGSSAVEGLNEALLAKAQAAKVLKTNKVRADTTVVPANVAYPTDSGLLAKGVAKMAKSIEKLKAGGPRLQDHLSGPDSDDAGSGPVHRCQPSTTHRGGKRRGHGDQCRHGPHRLRRPLLRPDRWRSTPAGRCASWERCTTKTLRDCRRPGDHRRAGRPDRRADRHASLW